MGSYNDIDIDLLLEKELEKLKRLVDTIQETNRTVVKNSKQFDDIASKYSELSLLINNIETKLVNPVSSEEFINRGAYQARQEEIDAQLLLVKKAQVSLNKQLAEFDNLVQGLTSNIESSFKKEISQHVSIHTFEKEINDLQKKVENVSSDAFKRKINQLVSTELFETEINKLNNKVEYVTSDAFIDKINQHVNIEVFDTEINNLQRKVENIASYSVKNDEIVGMKNSLDIVIKDVGDIYRLAGEIDKEKISKLEIKTKDNLKKITDQINQFSLKIDIQSEALVSMKKEFKGLIPVSKFKEFEKNVTEKTTSLNEEIDNLRLQNKALMQRMENQNAWNITFAIILFVLSVSIITLFR